jgi:hypothetical protein
MLGSLACGGPNREPPLDNNVINAGLDPTNPRILGLVAHFEANGIHLVHDRGGWWRVTQPASPDFEVMVSLRAFPEGASVNQIEEALTQINLAYLLNPMARVAMSYPSIRGGRPETVKDARFIRLKVELERLFHEYRPASAKQ